MAARATMRVRHGSNGQWASKLGELAEFFKKNGHYPMGGASEPSERKLYRWVAAQRAMRAGTARTALDEGRAAAGEAARLGVGR